MQSKKHKENNLQEETIYKPIRRPFQNFVRENIFFKDTKPKRGTVFEDLQLVKKTFSNIPLTVFRRLYHTLL